MPCTTQPQAKKKISRSTQKGGAQQDLVVHPRAPSHHQAHAVVLAPSATLGSMPELIDAEAKGSSGGSFWLVPAAPPVRRCAGGCVTGVMSPCCRGCMPCCSAW